MRRLLLLASLLISLDGCPNTTAAEGEGEGQAGEGEGQAGEGEGQAGEGEGQAGEGEGQAGEGEGQAGEGEGEGGNGTGGVGAACTNNSFCTAPLVCGFDTSHSPLTTTCQAPPSTGSAVGTPCQQATDCGFHLCEGNNAGSLCSAPCRVDGDCGVNMTCTTSSFTVDGVGGITDICVPNANLPPTPCSDDSACTATNQLCNNVVTQGADLVFQCGFPGTGGGIGAACGPGGSLNNDTECHTGLCDGDVNGQCTAACNDNSDCGGNGFICTGSGFSNVPGELCAKFCTKESDCGAGAGRSCQLRDNAVANRLDQTCTPDDGTQPTGFVTSTSSDCQTGFTINNSTTSFCSAICAVDADCAGFNDASAGHVAVTHCGTVAFTKPGGGGTQNVNVCVTP